MLEKIISCHEEDEFLKADGFDEAIIGVEPDEMRLIYSVSRCLNILRRTMSVEEAYNHFYTNVMGSHVGDKTPIWCDDDFPD